MQFFELFLSLKQAVDQLKNEAPINQSKTLSMLGTNYDTYLICLKTSQKLDPFKDITHIYAR